MNEKQVKLPNEHDKDVLLNIKDLKKYFPITAGFFKENGWAYPRCR